MAVIKKKTAVRGTEGGVKYMCDVCFVDITSTVSRIAVLSQEPTSISLHRELSSAPDDILILVS